MENKKCEDTPKKFEDTNIHIQKTYNTENSETISTQISALFDPKYLDCAFKEAEKALIDNEVPVGCVFVKHKAPETELKDKELYSNQLFDTNKHIIISRGRNTVNATKNATRHAEINCIDEVHYSLFKGM